MSLYNDLRQAFPLPHPAGRPFILGGLAAVILGLVVGWAWIAWLGLAFTLFCLFFFRDPQRVPPGRPGLILAPRTDAWCRSPLPFPRLNSALARSRAGGSAFSSRC
jgi:phosphatidylserine decarboxylase